MNQLQLFTDAAWWQATVDDLNVCDFSGKAGPLTGEQRRDFEAGDYRLWLFGNNRFRLVMLPDPCYQTGYNGSTGFLLYRAGSRVVVTPVLDGYYSRADNSIDVDFGVLGEEEIIEILTGTGGLHPDLINYYFVVDRKTKKATPKNLFRGDKGLTNEVRSAMLMSEPKDVDLPADAAPLRIIVNHRLTREFSIYAEDEEGKIDDNGRKLTRTVLHWNGHIYK